MLATFAVLFAACTNPPVVNGRVLDIWNKPIEGAMVKMEGEVNAQTTASDGSFQFPAKDGSMRFRAGHEGYIHDVEVGVFSSSDEEPPPTVTFHLYKKPEKEGFYAISTDDYATITGQKVQSIETQLQSIKGIKDIGEATVSADQSDSFLFFSTLRKEQIKQFKLQLHALTFTESVQIKSITGVTEAAVNLYTVADQNPIEFDLVSLDQDYMYLLKPKSALAAGYYAFHDSDILTNQESNSLASQPAELRVVYSFEVK